RVPTAPAPGRPDPVRRAVRRWRARSTGSPPSTHDGTRPGSCGWPTPEDTHVAQRPDVPDPRRVPPARPAPPDQGPAEAPAGHPAALGPARAALGPSARRTIPPAGAVERHTLGRPVARRTRSPARRRGATPTVRASPPAPRRYARPDGRARLRGLAHPPQRPPRRRGPG